MTRSIGFSGIKNCVKPVVFWLLFGSVLYTLSFVKLPTLPAPIQTSTSISKSDSEIIAIANNASEETQQIDEVLVPNETEAISFVKDRLNYWKASWEQGDAEAYISAYGAKYFPATFSSKEKWISDRLEKIRPERAIAIEIEDLTISPMENNRIVKTQFIQHYRSKQYRDTAQKTLVWAIENGVWVIVDEQSQLR